MPQIQRVWQANMQVYGADKVWRQLRREGITTSEAQRVKELEREVKELRRANEILKLASAFFAQAEQGRRLKS